MMVKVDKVGQLPLSCDILPCLITLLAGPSIVELLHALLQKHIFGSKSPIVVPQRVISTQCGVIIITFYFYPLRAKNCACTLTKAADTYIVTETAALMKEQTQTLYK